MNEQKQFNPETDFNITINKEYLDDIISNNFGKDTKLTVDQWEKLYYKVEELISISLYPEMEQAITDILEYAKLIERNKHAESVKPCYLVRFRHPNAFVREWKDSAFLKTEEDAKSYIKYNHTHGEDEEWKIEKID